MSFGPHIDRIYAKGGIVEHVRKAREIARGHGFVMEAYQIFVAGPQNVKMVMTEEEAVALKEYNLAENLSGVAHNTYVSNIWGDKFKYYASNVNEQMALCAKAGLKGFVLHLPVLPKLKPDAVREILLRGLRPLNVPEGLTLFLEIPNSKPENARYNTPEKLETAIQSIDGDPEIARKYAGRRTVPIGICVDTAHLWSSGIDLTTRRDAEFWIGRLEDLLPEERIMFHLNDSKMGFGGGKDSHDALAQGNIWGGYAEDLRESGLNVIVDFAMEKDCIVILERHAEKNRKPPEAILDDYDVLHRLCPALRA